VLDFGGFEVTRLGLQNGGSRGENVHHLFPTMRSDNRHPSNLVGVLLEKPKVFPTRLPFGSVHFCKVREDTDRVLLMLCNEEFKLRLECFEVFVRDRSGYPETECGSSSFLKSFNHRRTSCFDYLANLLPTELSVLRMPRLPHRGRDAPAFRDFVSASAAGPDDDCQGLLRKSR
jgi:hypothetical protein